MPALAANQTPSFFEPDSQRPNEVSNNNGSRSRAPKQDHQSTTSSGGCLGDEPGTGSPARNHVLRVRVLNGAGEDLHSFQFLPLEILVLRHYHVRDPQLREGVSCDGKHSRSQEEVLVDLVRQRVHVAEFNIPAQKIVFRTKRIIPSFQDPNLSSPVGNRETEMLKVVESCSSIS